MRIKPRPESLEGKAAAPLAGGAYGGGGEHGQTARTPLEAFFNTSWITDFGTWNEPMPVGYDR